MSVQARDERPRQILDGETSQRLGADSSKNDPCTVQPASDARQQWVESTASDWDGTCHSRLSSRQACRKHPVAALRLPIPERPQRPNCALSASVRFRSAVAVKMAGFHAR